MRTFALVVILLSISASLLSSCGGQSFFQVTKTVEDPQSVRPSASLVPLTVTFTPTITLIPTTEATSTSTPLPPTITATPTWIYQTAGEVICPILLYHQIADIDPPSQYHMPPEDFKAQMESLYDWGYTPIPISLLARAITSGAELPSRPVVVTFDDGDQNVYTNAFPVMQELGFPGVIYIISNAVDSQSHLTSAEILEMVAAGWEVGDHSMTHLNLTSDHGQVWTEASQSRLELKAALGIPINTFAYPYGAADTFVMEKISEYGYQAAVGLGTSSRQGPDNLFYLNRIEVKYGTNLEQFAELLPWSDRLR
jgi:peptidoglycan/xylan/chitin deacetylase (PgdA/CDA1 family)